MCIVEYAYDVVENVSDVWECMWVGVAYVVCKGPWWVMFVGKGSTEVIACRPRGAMRFGIDVPSVYHHIVI